MAQQGRRQRDAEEHHAGDQPAEPPSPLLPSSPKKESERPEK